MKSSSKTKNALRFSKGEVDALLMATIKLEAIQEGRWRFYRDKILKTYINSFLSREESAVLTFTKSEFCDLVRGVDAVACATGGKKWEYLHAKLLWALNCCEKAESEE